MSLQVQGFGGVVAEVDGTVFRALRVTGRPIDYGSLGYYSIAMITGTMAVSLVANSEVFQFRWPDATRFSVVTQVTCSASALVAATAAALCSFRATLARGWTVAGSGGARATMTGNNQKLRTSMGTSLVNDIGCSTTAALTAGTKTIDAQDVSAVGFSLTTGALTVQMSSQFCPLTYLLDINSLVDHPWVFAQNEGFVVRSGNAMPAGATWQGVFGAKWAEVTAY
jgi:hypothetical protein